MVSLAFDHPETRDFPKKSQKSFNAGRTYRAGPTDPCSGAAERNCILRLPPKKELIERKEP
jgi:hypothetical protein